MLRQQQQQIHPPQQAHEQVAESQQAKQAGHPSQPVYRPVAERRGQQHRQREQQAAGGVAYLEQLAQRLAGQHHAGGVEAQVHDAGQRQRQHRALDAKLRAAGQHLRQAQPGALRAVQRHYRAAGDLPQQQAGDGPDDVAAQRHGQRAGDDGGDLQIGRQPQGELAEYAAMPLAFGDEVYGTALDQRRACGRFRFHGVFSFVCAPARRLAAAPAGTAGPIYTLGIPLRKSGDIHHQSCAKHAASECNAPRKRRIAIPHPGFVLTFKQEFQ